MAITEDIGFPRLTPHGDRMPSGRRLFRSPEELTDDQFDLLAAAWAEYALTGDALTEMESVMAAIPGRRERAESYRSIRLAPGHEKWAGMNRALRSSPVRTALRRTLIPAILTAAAMLVLVIYGPAGAKLKNLNNPDLTDGTTAMTVAEIQGSRPIIIDDRTVTNTREPSMTVADRKNNIQADHGIPDDKHIPSDKIVADDHLIASVPVIAGGQTSIADFREATFDRIMPMITNDDNASMVTIAPAKDINLATLKFPRVNPPAIIPEEKNWMLRSISFLASAVTGKEKEIDGYIIASSCVNGLNTILGWDMELEQVSNRAGDPVAVSFSSSLLSFTKPVNKTTP